MAKIQRLDAGIEDRLWPLFIEAYPELIPYNNKLNDLIKDVLFDDRSEESISRLQGLLTYNYDLNREGADIWRIPEEVLKTKQEIWDRVEQESLPLNTMVRFAKIMCHVLGRDAREVNSPLPVWSHYLLDQRLQAGNYDTSHGDSMVVQTCESVSAIEASPLAWLHYVFDWNESHLSRERSEEDIFRRIPGLKSYLVEHCDVLETMWLTFSYPGRLWFLTFVESLQLTFEYSNLLISALMLPSHSLQDLALRCIPQANLSLAKETVIAGLTADESEFRIGAAMVIIKLMESEARAPLLSARSTEKDPAVIAVQEDSLMQTGEDLLNGNQAQPVPPPCERVDLTNQVDDDYVDLLHMKIKQEQARANSSTGSNWQRRYADEFNALTRSDASDYAAMLNGEKAQYEFPLNFYAHHDAWHHPSVGLVNIARAENFESVLQNWLIKHPGELSDLRMLQELSSVLGGAEDVVEKMMSNVGYGAWEMLIEYLPGDGIWPYFSNRLDLLHYPFFKDKAQTSFPHSLDGILNILATFPSIPQRVHYQLLELAWGSKKKRREKAQEILSDAPLIVDLVLDRLSSIRGREEVIVAVNWLAELGDARAVALLARIVVKEKREVVRAVLLAAIDTLGGDISNVLSPKALLEEASRGLKKTTPPALHWFPFETIPALQYTDGETVPADVVRWWVILACKLKDPAHSLIRSYLKLLDRDSIDLLGIHIVSSFIHHDTLILTEIEVRNIAEKESPHLLQKWQNSGVPDLQRMTLAEARKSIIDELAVKPVGSAIKAKGILSLAAFSSAHDVLDQVQQFMKTHYKRTPQITAMVSALGSNDSPPVIQWILAISRKYRTQSIQTLAGQLAERIGQRKGWTIDQLSDKTLVAAGFDDNGAMELDFGERKFTVFIGDDLKLLIKNQEDKVIKSLPQPRKGEDQELVKEAKSRLSRSRKELKQTVAATTERYYQSMCNGRVWPCRDWIDDILAHPIAGIMASRLIWRYADANGSQFIIPDAAFVKDALNGTGGLSDSGEISLAHGAEMYKDHADKLIPQLKAEVVTPLFEQLNRIDIHTTLNLNQKLINTYRGFLTDTFTLKGIFNRLGYSRDVIGDAGSFTEYYREFPAAGVKAVIDFSGSYVPEQEILAALGSLYFVKVSPHFSESILLSEVPRIILSECVAHYESVASKTKGYDENWEVKTEML